LTGATRQATEAIAALDAQRAVLGDAVVDAAIAALRAQQVGAAPADPPRGDPGQGEGRRSADAEAPVDLSSTPPGAAPSERRQVTILFADIVGSTTIAEHADPEDVAEIVDGAFAVMTRAIDDHGGRVGRLMGDGMLAFFGAPISHEDDPLRAVRAACAIRDGVAAYGARLAARGGPPVQVRVGIHTGRVLAGQIGGGRHGEYTTIGDAANTAARIESNAPHGQVLISEATARLVRGAVALSPHGALALKGKRQPVVTHIVEDAPAAAVPRGFDGSPLVGRGAELAALHGLARDAFEGAGRIAVIEADAGLGKTRLLAELRAVVERELPGRAWLDATGEAARMGEPYALLRDLVARRCDIRPSEGGSVAREKLAAHLAAAFVRRQGPPSDQDVAADDPMPDDPMSDDPSSDAALAAADIAALLGFGALAGSAPPAAQAAREARDRALASLGAWLAAVGRAAGGAIVALDDLHWADDASRASLPLLAAACARAPVLLIASARPGTTLAADLGGEHIALQPLAADEQRALVDGLEAVVPGGLDEAVRERVMARSGGNPYYAEELVRMLRDGSGDIDALPPTLAGLLQARIDGLPGGERGALQRAAVVGRVFWDDAVAELGAGDSEAATTGRDLDALEGRSLVAVRPRSAFAGFREYAIAHALLRDAAFGNLLLANRRALHARAAAWLADRAGDRILAHAGEIAAHHAAAGDGLAAARWYLRAARRAADVFANADALDACAKGLAALGGDQHAEPGVDAVQAPSLDGLHAALLALRCEVNDRLGDRAAQRADVAALRELAQRLGPAAMARALNAEADLLWATADFAGARRAAEAGLTAIASASPTAATTATAADDDADLWLLEGTLLRNAGRAARESGDYAAARAAFEDAAARFAACGATRAGADALVQIGALDSELGDFAAARPVLERALDATSEPEALPERAWALDNLAIVHACLGELDAALARGTEALSLARRFGGRRRELSNRINLAAIATLLGGYADARHHAQRARDLARSVDDPSGEALACFGLAEISRSEGDGVAAVAHAEAGCAAAAVLGRAFLDVLGDYALAGALLARAATGDAAAALGAAERCMAAAGAAGLASYRVVGLARRAEALGQLGRAAEAAQAARETSAALAAVGAIEEPEQLVHLAVYRALADVGDAGADRALRAAGRAVLVQARRIADRQARLAFLERVAVNRAVRMALGACAR